MRTPQTLSQLTYNIPSSELWHLCFSPSIFGSAQKDTKNQLSRKTHQCQYQSFGNSARPRSTLDQHVQSTTSTNTGHLLVTCRGVAPLTFSETKASLCFLLYADAMWFKEVMRLQESPPSTPRWRLGTQSADRAESCCLTAVVVTGSTLEVPFTVHNPSLNTNL